jgi:hypothetical protein
VPIGEWMRRRDVCTQGMEGMDEAEEVRGGGGVLQYMG